MALWEIAILIIAIAFAIGVFALIPALLQLRATLKASERTLDDLDATVKSLVDDEVKPFLRSLSSTIVEIDGVVQVARQGVEKVDYVLESLRGVGDTIRGIDTIFDEKVKGTLIDLIALTTGVKVGVSTFVKSVKALSKKEVA